MIKHARLCLDKTWQTRRTRERSAWGQASDLGQPCIRHLFMSFLWKELRLRRWLSERPAKGCADLDRTSGLQGPFLVRRKSQDSYLFDRQATELLNAPGHDADRPAAVAVQPVLGNNLAGKSSHHLAAIDACGQA